MTKALVLQYRRTVRGVPTIFQMIVPEFESTAMLNDAVALTRVVSTEKRKVLWHLVMGVGTAIPKTFNDIDFPVDGQLEATFRIMDKRWLLEIAEMREIDIVDLTNIRMLRPPAQLLEELDTSIVNWGQITLDEDTD